MKIRVAKLCIPTLFAVILMGLTIQAARATTSIFDFEDQPPGTIITTQYVGRGLVLPAAGQIDTIPPAHSGSRVLRPTNQTEFFSGPFELQFTSGQSRVQLFAGTSDALPAVTVTGTLRAFNAAQILVGQDGPKAVQNNVTSTSFEVRTSTPDIVRIDLLLQGRLPNGQQYDEIPAIDDLTLEGDPPKVIAAPTVTITFPTSGQQVSTSFMTVQGTVSGASLQPNAVVTVEAAHPPRPHPPPFVTLAPLAGSGQTMSFSLAVPLVLGPQLITVRASNVQGLSGSASVQFTNLSKPISDRFVAAGGAGVLGDLQWVASSGKCAIAVYRHGAIASSGATTFLVAGMTFTKWLQWFLTKFGEVSNDAFCPLAEERAAPGMSRAQDFLAARVYSTALNAYYVPGVFLPAIDRLGGETSFGVPVSDPKRASAARTWLFQQFRRQDG